MSIAREKPEVGSETALGPSTMTSLLSEMENGFAGNDRDNMKEIERRRKKKKREDTVGMRSLGVGKWRRRLASALVAFLALFWILRRIALLAPLPLPSTSSAPMPERARVGLDVYIMSKCPDARDCLHDLVLPAMQRIADRVDFRLEYIGNTTADHGVSCKHGEGECLGNIIELCAAHEYPDPRMYLGFTMCLEREYRRIPERSLIEDCALEHGIDLERLNGCTTDQDGYLSVDLLQSSFGRTARANVTKSCTVRLDGKIRCIRDDGEWKDCPAGSEVKDLVRDVMHLTSGDDDAP